MCMATSAHTGGDVRMLLHGIFFLARYVQESQENKGHMITVKIE